MTVSPFGGDMEVFQRLNDDQLIFVDLFSGYFIAVGAK